jgi:hypothetical protein
MPKATKFFSLISVALLGLAWTTTVASAGVECEGDFQTTKYGLIATPYCEEENIAVVAQSYGWKVTASQVRNDPLKKVYICQVLGRDIRLKGSCAGYSPDAYAPGR